MSNDSNRCLPKCDNVELSLSIGESWGSLGRLPPFALSGVGLLALARCPGVYAVGVEMKASFNGSLNGPPEFNELSSLDSGSSKPNSGGAGSNVLG